MSLLKAYHRLARTGFIFLFTFCVSITVGQMAYGDCLYDCTGVNPMAYPTHIQDYDRDGYTIAQGDCDDLDPNEHPGQIWFKDQDNDGYSDGVSQVVCERPASYKIAAELYKVAGDIDDTIPDPYITAQPVVVSIRPAPLAINGQVTITGKSFGNFKGSGYISFSNQNETLNILSWTDNTIVAEAASWMQNSCLEIVTVAGKSNCMNYIVARPMPWLLILKTGI